MEIKSKLHLAARRDQAQALRLGVSLLAAAGAGAALMYFFDPQRGRRRRVLARGKLNSLTNRTTGAVGATSRGLRNRAYGILAGTKNLVSRQQVSDEVLAERVRARLGSLVSHASAVQVWCENGRITLSGTVLAPELARLLRGVSAIRGVAGVDNLLTVERTPESFSGATSPVHGRFAGIAVETLRKPWETTRLLIGGFGSVLALGGAIRRNISGRAAALLGMALLASALSAKRFWRSAGAQGEHSGMDNGVPHHNGTGNGAGASE
jgi:hypothetical protein